MDTDQPQPSTPTVSPVLDHNKMFDLAEQLITLRDDKDKLEDRLKKLNMFIEEIEYKLSDAMALSETQNFACKDAVAISVIAKDYGWSAKRMNSFLHECGIQFKQGNIWLLYQNHAQKGYTDTKTHVYTGKDGEPHSTVHTYWTQKGRLFIYETMKAKGFLPLIERGNAA